jgi:sugar lactone lactonase YvrE
MQDGVGTLAMFDAPMGLVMSSDNEVAYVADSQNEVIRRILISTRMVSSLPIDHSMDFINIRGIALQRTDSVLIIVEQPGRVRRMYGTCDTPTSTPTTPAPTLYRS